MDRLTSSLQESVLTLIATNDKQGRIAAGMLKPEMFDDDYENIAERILKFRKKHKTAPGAQHIDDIMDDVLDNSSHKKHRFYLKIAEGILAQAPSLNADYVLSRVDEFTQRQRLKSAILKAADVYQTGKDDTIEQVEGILHRALKPRRDDLSLGTFLNQRGKVLNFLDKLHADYKTGIAVFDKYNFGPTCGQMLVLMGAKGTGKSWFCTDMGVRCLQQGAKVLHITLEMPEEQCVGRYIQRLWAISKRDEKYTATKLILDDIGRVIGIKRRFRSPRRSLESWGIRRYLRKNMKLWGTRLSHVVVKEFPTKSLSVAKLEAYLDSLELRHNFIPNVLILDYPDLMWMEKSKDLRLSVGNTFQELRGLLQRRNLAGIMPTQTNRKGWEAITVKGSMVSEDASKFMTADMGVIYSRTPMEKKLGLARLYVEKNRNDIDGYTVVITQRYATGQFCTSSALQSQKYTTLIGPEDTDDENDDSGE